MLGLTWARLTVICRVKVALLQQYLSFIHFLLSINKLDSVTLAFQKVLICMKGLSNTHERG